MTKNRLTLLSEQNTLNDEMKAIEARIEAIQARRTQITTLLSVSLIVDTNKVRIASSILRCKGEVEDDKGYRDGFSVIEENVRHKLLDAAIAEAARRIPVFRGCKNYVRWKDQPCYSFPRHGYMTYYVTVNREVSEEEADAVVHVLTCMKQGVLTTEQYLVMQEEATTEAA